MESESIIARFVISFQHMIVLRVAKREVFKVYSTKVNNNEWTLFTTVL